MTDLEALGVTFTQPTHENEMAPPPQGPPPPPPPPHPHV